MQQYDCLICGKATTPPAKLCPTCQIRPTDYDEFTQQKLATSEDQYLKRYYGVELEVEQCFNKRLYTDFRQHWAYINRVFPEGVRFLYPKNETTIHYGIELVSAPATHSARRQLIDWHEVLKTLRTLGYTSFASGRCGIHIHVDRRRVPAIEQLNACMMRLNQFATHFSRRSSESLAHWCQIPTAACITRGKSNAINLRDNTVEFRLFRGTLRWKTFLACLQFTAAFVDFATIQTPSIVRRKMDQKTFLKTFIHFVKWRGYTHLYQYIQKNRRIQRACASLLR